MVKWTLLTLAVALACASALPLRTASAQQPRDPLISPQEGADGSRFQIVGQSGWTPGETVTIRLAFTPTDPLAPDGTDIWTGDTYHERQVTVLRDGTWSFPITVPDELFPFILGDTPGFILVRAESPSKNASNAWVYSPGGRRPPGAEAIAGLGFGPGAPSPALATTLALFAAATGALLILSGARRQKGH
ncbi:MAG: hypothetical protein WEC75_08325 [Dehalococcoidia bacterium]